MPASGPQRGTFRQHKMSMKFANQSVEDAFLKVRSKGLLHAVGRASLLGCVALLFQGFRVRSQTFTDWEDLPGIDIYAQVATMVTCGMWLVVGGALLFTRPSELLSPRAQEPMTLAMVSTWVFAVLFLNPITAALFANIDPATSTVVDFDINDENAMLLYLSERAFNFAIVNTFWHLAMPVRWSLAIWFEALSWLAFAANDAALRPTFAVKTIIVVLGFVLGSSLGLRTLETKERALFAHASRTLGAESECRAGEAEFGAEMQHAEPVDRNLGDGRGEARTETSSIQESSIPETTTTGAMFNEAEQAGPATLGQIMTLGRKEQWLIEAEDLDIADSKVLGRGGFGLVRTGILHCTKVAIKMPEGNRPMLESPEAFEDESIQALLNEVRVLRKARHPNIVLFFGACIGNAGASGSSVWLVLEYVHGQMLTTAISRLDAKDPESRRAKDLLSVAVMISEALHYLHKQRPHIVHSDVKPGNILVENRTGGPFPKLLDFGLSRLATRRNQYKGGTPQYMPPEILREPGAKPSIKGDVFSFGRLLFFISSGRKPLAGTEPGGMLRLLRSLVPPTVEWHPTTRLLKHCRPIIESCTTDHPQERPSLAWVCLDLGAVKRHVLKAPARPAHHLTATPSWTSSLGKGEQPGTQGSADDEPGAPGALDRHGPVLRAVQEGGGARGKDMSHDSL